MKRRNFIGGLAVALAVPVSLKALETSVKGITMADRFILRQQDAETLAEWSCILNGWGWPKLLPDAEPPTYIPNGRRSQIMRWIYEHVGAKAVSWKHNQSVMSKKQFDLWWEHGGNSEVYKARYPFSPEESSEDRRKRSIHTRAMYARHGAQHLEYIES